MLPKPPFPTLQDGHPLAQGLLLALPCYEGSGKTLNDLAGSKHGASLNGGVTWTGGQFGWCPLFDGSTGYGITPSFALPNYGQILVSCWVKTGTLSSGSRYTVFEAGDATQAFPEFELVGMSAAEAALNIIVPGVFLISGGGVDYSQGFTANGTWNHVFWWVDASTTTAGVGWNGSIVAAKNYGAQVFGSGASVKYVGQRDNSSQQFPGALDGLAVYALPPGSGSNIAALAAALYADSFQLFRRRPPVFKATAGGTASGAGTAAFAFTAASGGAELETGAGAAAVTFTAAGVGAALAVGSGAAAFAFSAAIGGAALAASPGAAAFAFTGSAVSAALAASPGAAAFAFTAASAGTGAAAGTAAFSFTAAGSGAAVAQGAGAAAFSFAGAIGGAEVETGAGAAALTFTAAAVGAALATGSGAAAFAFTAAAFPPAGPIPTILFQAAVTMQTTLGGAVTVQTDFAATLELE